ncbi:hypothetical protein [Salinivibrio sp. PR6]|nr:hypothetical protein [Salinivibrio sp. PR6]
MVKAFLFAHACHPTLSSLEDKPFGVAKRSAGLGAKRIADGWLTLSPDQR